ncbi:MAG TPA: hypothetical protein VF074_22335 [Pyrinomonadaceae bacterium]
MSEDTTKGLKDSGSFEQRVFARFDRMEIRLTSLEERQYDTKPIWERALAEIAETNRAIQELRTELQTGIEGLRTEMKSEFAAVRHEMEHGLRGVARTIDTLNQNCLQIQTDQRYVDRRLEYLETQIKST